MLGARHSHAPRVLALLSPARDQAQRVGFTGFAEQPIGLELLVACPRDRNRSDATNYLGGVGDVLEDKAHRVNLEHLGDLASFGLYANDRQIEEVRYHWEPRESPLHRAVLDAGGSVVTATSFTRIALETGGLTGWTTFKRMREEDKVPRVGGIYIVARGSAGTPEFLDANPGGRFRGKDPSVSEEALRSNWDDAAEVLYIGKADELRRRLRQFADFGAGKPIGHWGGRLIWQLVEAETLLVAWKETPGEVPVHEEARLINEFRDRYGKPPFANDPHRLGA